MSRPWASKEATWVDPTTWSVADLAYLAGFIDGEGCISSHVRRTNSGAYWGVRIRIRQRDKDAITWAHETFGGTYFHGHSSGFKYGINHCWTISGYEAIPVLRAALPYFKLKRGQALAALALYADPRPESEEQERLGLLIKRFNQRTVRLKPAFK